MATYTAGDQINRALRLLGVLAEGETPSASESADALMALNQMLDSWNTESLSVYATNDQVFTWPAGAASRSLGPTGDFVGVRPVVLDEATYYRDPGTGISYGVQFINQEQYDAIALKTATTTYPQVLFINTGYPNNDLFLYPVPTRALEWHFITPVQLDQPASLTTVLNFPPGYMRAFVYNLAMEIAPEFGIEPPNQVRRIAVTSKRNLKRTNSPDDVLALPSAVLNGPARYNIFAGNN